METRTVNEKELITFFEIPAIDFNRAVNFYEKVFETKIGCCDYGVEQMGFFPDHRCGVRGAISRAEDFHPSSDGVLLHFAADNIDIILQRVVEAGGRILRSKTKIDAEGQGYFALLVDTEGNRIGIHQQE